MQTHVVRRLQTCWFPDVWQDSAETAQRRANSFCHKLCWVTCSLVLYTHFLQVLGILCSHQMNQGRKELKLCPLLVKFYLWKYRKSSKSIIIMVLSSNCGGFVWVCIYWCPTFHLNKLVHQSNKDGSLNGALHIPLNIPSACQTHIKSDLRQNNIAPPVLAAPALSLCAHPGLALFLGEDIQRKTRFSCQIYSIKESLKWMSSLKEKPNSG